MNAGNLAALAPLTKPFPFTDGRAILDAGQCDLDLSVVESGGIEFIKPPDNDRRVAAHACTERANPRSGRETLDTMPSGDTTGASPQEQPPDAHLDLAQIWAARGDFAVEHRGWDNWRYPRGWSLAPD